MPRRESRRFAALAGLFGITVSAVAIWLVLSPLRAESISYCQLNDVSCVVISGQLSEDDLEIAFSKRHDLKRVFVNSIGGNGDLAMKIGNVILETKSDVYVFGNCLSACAEFLLPPAQEIFAINEPVIGVHGNPFLIEDLYKRRGIVIPDHCEWKSLQWLRNVYRQKGLQESFFLEEEKRMKLNIKTSMDEDNCPVMSPLSKGQPIWVPTREEILTKWGLAINGKLCSDSSVCMRRLPASTFVQ